LRATGDFTFCAVNSARVKSLSPDRKAVGVGSSQFFLRTGDCFPFRIDRGSSTIVSVAQSVWNKGSNSMTDSPSNVALYDEDAFIDDLSDAALEIAGKKLCEGPVGAATISFCSAYDTCPWERRL